MPVASTTKRPIDVDVALAHLELLHPAGTVYEIRIPRWSDHPEGLYPSTVSGFFNDHHAAAAEIVRMMARGSAPGVYCTINPVVSSLLAVSTNRLKPKAKKSATDAEVERRTTLFLDLDSVRPSEISATKTETVAAMKFADTVRDFLTESGFPEPIRLMTGNGAALQYRIDLPATDTENGMVTEFLHVLAAKFADVPGVKVDCSVFNAARIAKVSGTWACKGEDMRGLAGVEDRPHRQVKLLSAPTTLEVVDESVIMGLIARLKPPAANPPAKNPSSARPRTANGEARYEKFDHTPEGVAGYLRRHGVEVKAIHGEKIVLARCAIIPECEAVNGTDICVMVRQGKISYHNLHNRGVGLQWADAREKIEPGYKSWSENREWERLPSAVSSSSPASRLPRQQPSNPATPPATKPSQKDLILDPSNPLEIAEQYRVDRFSHADGPTLFHASDVFWNWNGRCFEQLENNALRAETYGYLKPALKWVGIGENKTTGPFKPTDTAVNKVTDALKATSYLKVQAPAWLSDAKGLPDPLDVIPAANGLIHLRAGGGPRIIRPPTPLFFSTNALDYCFDPDAPEPAEWLKFLDSCWPDDQQSIELLQEWFGYAASLDTRQQKMLLVVGPPRSGKGTIARVLSSMIGVENYRGPTLAAMGTNFGLWPLIGAQLAIISDARLSSRSDQAIVTERLLSISGEDTITIDRKNMQPWTGKLPTRIMILSNELPRLSDASGALANRFLILMLENSFLGKEDTGLTDRIRPELPGILKWAFEGWRRLQSRGRFIQPDTSQDAIEEMLDLSSPLGGFVRDWCKTDPALTVARADIYEAYVLWAREQGINKPSENNVFARDLRAALPRISSFQPKEGDARYRAYRGIGLTLAARETLSVSRNKNQGGNEQ
jgi:putative DNA primase/helicase